MTTEAQLSDEVAKLRNEAAVWERQYDLEAKDADRLRRELNELIDGAYDYRFRVLLCEGKMLSAMDLVEFIRAEMTKKIEEVQRAKK